jgi:DNA-binding transcriptional LysR family regulator
VSRRLAALEAQLGERLMQRTTRKLSLTDIGQAVLEHARQVVAQSEAAAALAQHRQLEPSGRLRVSMPADFATTVLGPLLAKFVQHHPAIVLELDLSPRRVDLIGENFDVALRMGDLADDATLAARLIATFSVGLYAAPSYLKRRGRPREPEALMQHDTLRLLTRAGELAPWVLARGDSRWQGSPPARASANAPDLLTLLARQGAGITAVADHFAEPHVAAGELVPVLPDWDLPSGPAWAVFPGRRLMPARTRVFLDALAAEFVGPRCAAQREKLARMRGTAAR